MMPDMGGLEVCEILKADPRYQKIPIIFLTASNEQENLIEAFEKGAVDCVVLFDYICLIASILR